MTLLSGTGAADDAARRHYYGALVNDDNSEASDVTVPGRSVTRMRQTTAVRPHPQLPNIAIHHIPPPRIVASLEEFATTMTVHHSRIQECLITKSGGGANVGGIVISNGRKCYMSILVDIWKTMPTQKLLQTTTFNFKLTDEAGARGYNWRDEIHMSVQGKSSNGCIKELLAMAKVNNLTIASMTVKLKTGEVVQILQQR